MLSVNSPQSNDCDNTLFVHFTKLQLPKCDANNNDAKSIMQSVVIVDVIALL